MPPAKGSGLVDLINEPVEGRRRDEAMGDVAQTVSAEVPRVVRSIRAAEVDAVFVVGELFDLEVGLFGKLLATS